MFWRGSLRVAHRSIWSPNSLATNPVAISRTVRSSSTQPRRSQLLKLTWQVTGSWIQVGSA